MENECVKFSRAHHSVVGIPGGDNLIICSPNEGKYYPSLAEIPTVFPSRTTLPILVNAIVLR